MKHLDVVIGISTYNDYTLLSYLLQSIRWHSTTFSGTYEILVCDDGTPDHQVEGWDISYKEKLQQVCDRFGASLVLHETNMGIPATWNHLANESSFAHSKHIIILNNDLLVAPYWLDSMVYFADNNKEFGGANLPYYHIEARNVEHVLETISQNSTVVVVDPITRQPIGDDRSQPIGEKPGKIMCMSGCNFIMRRDVFEKVGPFDERIVSFHEESSYGTRAAAEFKYPSWCLPWPNIYHVWGYTFSENQDTLKPSKRMAESRKIYCETWDVPDEFASNPFEYTDPKYMPLIPKRQVKWLLGSSNRCIVDRDTGQTIVLEPEIKEVQEEI